MKLMQSGPDDKSGGGLNIASKFACESGPMGFYPGGGLAFGTSRYLSKEVLPKVQSYRMIRIFYPKN